MIDGVYENMPADEYHALPRLSASGIKKLLVSPLDFWASSWLNKERYTPERDAFNLGTAYHMRLLEGANAFDDAYAPDFDRRKFPDAPDTIAEIRAALNGIGVKPKGTKKEDLIAQLQLEAPFIIPMATIEKIWADENAGKTLIPRRIFNEIEDAALCAARRGLFTGGKPELTILWTDDETATPMKSRIDYLRPTAIDDVKTFSNSRDIPIPRLITSHIANFRYYLQAEVYRAAARSMGADDGAIPFNFVFVQTGAAPNIIVAPFGEDLLLAQKGRDEMRYGINLYARMAERYGTDPWYGDAPTFVLKDESFPLYTYEEGD